MKCLKGELEVLRDDYKTKVVEFSDRSNQNDTSSTMLRAMKDKHAKELELLKEVRTNPTSQIFQCIISRTSADKLHSLADCGAAAIPRQQEHRGPD